MDAQRYLLDSDEHRRRRNRWLTSGGSIVFHCLLVVAFVIAGAHSAKDSKASEKSINAFVTQGAAPPPPPPPPPPPKGSAAQKSTPRVQPKPVEIPRTSFVAPIEIKELPKLEPLPTAIDLASLPNMTSSVEEPAGVEGGVAGGVEGGETGGVIGGVIGGVQGGETGGVLGGEVGGTGTGTEGTGTGGVEAPVVAEPPPPPPPPPVPSGPLRVGGDVKAPVATNRAEPNYTDTARKSRIEGVVIVEAIISRSGSVEDVRVVKGLPMGLSEEAKEAVKKWRFKPGTMNGVPVATIFNLTVTFKLK